MATPELDAKLTPLEYVERADREWAFGNQRKAAALMWKATEITFTKLAGHWELEGGDLLSLAQTLDAEKSLSQKRYLGGLVAGELLHDYAEMEGLETGELQDAYRATRQFIVECHGEPE